MFCLANCCSNLLICALMESAASTLSFPGPAEDDGSLSVAAGLAKEAALLFQSGKFLECSRILNQLLLKKPDDPKVNWFILLAFEFFVDLLFGYERF